MGMPTSVSITRPHGLFWMVGVKTPWGPSPNEWTVRTRTPWGILCISITCVKKGMRIVHGDIAQRQSGLCFTYFSPTGASGSVRLAPTATCLAEVNQAALAETVVTLPHGAMPGHADVAGRAFTPCRESRDAAAAAFEVPASGMLGRVEQGAVLTHAALFEALDRRRVRVGRPNGHLPPSSSRPGAPRPVKIWKLHKQTFPCL